MGKGEDKPAGETEGGKVADLPINKEKEPETTKEAPKEIKEKKDLDSIRKVIKVEQPNKPTTKTNEEKTTEPAKKDKTPEKKDDILLDDGASSGREALEQKRAILQNIKDFDFQIKKNQEDIGSINKKLDAMSKDLDDLVSLYEIVSEQMNPFVGLSKVTKKRLDALENFTREIDLLKERTGELESFAERSGAKLQILGEGKEKAKTIDTDALLGEKNGKEDKKPIDEKEKTVEQKSKDEKKEPETKTEIRIEEKEKIKTSQEDTTSMQALSEEIKPQTTSEDIFGDTFDSDLDIYTGETFQPTPTYVNPKMDNNISDEVLDMDLDRIFEIAFGSLTISSDAEIDMLIDEFIESLKG